MPHTLRPGERDLSVYDSMSDEALQQLLRDDFSKPEGEESDTETLLAITEVLAKRRNERNEGKSPAQAWESFQQNYCTQNEEPYISEIVPTPKKRGGGHWKRGLAAAAAVLVLIIGGSATAKAFKFDLWGFIANWNKETFHFSSSTKVTQPQETVGVEPPVSTGLRQTLQAYHITTPLAPSWFPEGWEEGEVRVVEAASKRVFFAQYQRGAESLIVRISDYSDGSSLFIEQSGGLIEVYACDGIDYYLFDNNGKICAAWITEHYECYIMGPLSVSEIKAIIDSIGKG